MSKKNLYLGGILIVLIVAAYVFNGPWQEWQENRNRTKNFLADLNIDQVDFIDINTEEQSITLEKTSGRWKVSGTKDFYVEDVLANELTAKLKEMQTAEVELVSENSEKKGEFGLEEPEAAAVELRQGENTLIEFWVGNPGSDFNSTYINKAGSNLSYLLKAQISDLFLRSEWYNHRIFSSDQEKVSKIRFQYPNREFTVEKNENGWYGSQPYRFNVSEEKIEEILALMTNLNAAKIPEQKFEGTDLEKNLIIIEASGEDLSNVLMVGGSDSEEEEFYFVKRGDSDNIYLITKDERDVLDVNIGSLR